MKKYIQPSVDVIEVETLGVIATSTTFEIYSSEESADQLIGRQRTNSWTSEDR
jgi:hypothetical protein